MNYKIKESLYILKNSEDIYSVIFTGTRRIKKFRVDGLVKNVLNYLGNPKEENELYDLLGGFNKEDIDLCLNSLEKVGIVRKYDEEKIEERYRKQILFIDELTSSWDETLFLHSKLRNSKIAIFGVGGVGTWVTNGLYQLGVGEFNLDDPDVVNESNLNRQLFFDSRDIGKYKVDVVKRKLVDAKINVFKKFVSFNEDLEKIVEGCDFLVNCADSPSVEVTSKVIDYYANKLDIAYCVAGGYNMHLGMVGPIIIPGKTKTFNEFLDYQKNNDSFSSFTKIKDIENPGNLGPIAGAIANMQVIEIFKHLIGKGEVNYNKFVEVDFMNLGLDWRKF